MLDNVIGEPPVFGAEMEILWTRYHGFYLGGGVLQSREKNFVHQFFPYFVTFCANFTGREFILEIYTSTIESCITWYLLFQKNKK